MELWRGGGKSCSCVRRAYAWKVPLIRSSGVHFISSDWEIPEGDCIIFLSSLLLGGRFRDIHNFHFFCVGIEVDIFFSFHFFCAEEFDIQASFLSSASEESQRFAQKWNMEIGLDI
ncbi:hypothetical protein Taro_029882 [Colocasia esculenta]|uniref:Uncharacterized protein n=1 Tax=Colocasia esculenta TaxID=4460 RepID=A0A843VW79_COLES|nr:hypothetical protein [Colocasia esculenta]